jgi:glutamine amidotransferase
MKMESVAIVDYGVGNLHSVRKGLAMFGAGVVITNDYNKIAEADRLVLPGVGGFYEAISVIKEAHLFDLIISFAKERPVLGICLGMQLLFSESTEGGRVAGLGIIKGSVRRFEGEMKVPHIGWNRVRFKEDPLFSKIPNNSYFYFVHSYYADPTEDVELAHTHYGNLRFISAVRKKNVFGVQFHPEKSSLLGLKILENFISI